MADVKDTLKQRGNFYGDWSNMATKAQDLKTMLRSSPNWDIMRPGQQEALDMIATKMARLLLGDPNHEDSWHDIAGYATLGLKVSQTQQG